MIEICKKALDHYGERKQLRKAQEECGELVAAINQYLDGRINKLELSSEIADVEIMVTQLKMMMDDYMVDILKDYKLDRLVERIDGTNNT